MVHLSEIIDLIDDHERRTGETMTELSRRVFGTTDTIRNWRRKLDAGEEGSASFKNVQSVLQAIGIDVILTGENAKIRSASDLLANLRRVDGISEDDAGSFMRMITNTIKANAASREQISIDDQSAPGTPRHESSPSR